MLKEVKQIPITPDSHPFITAVNACEFEKNGYLEDEYFLTGTANIYEEDSSGVLTVSTPDAPYTTRILVRRPAELSRFSGNVVIEVLNSSANYDIDRDWQMMWRHIIRHGDIYIGISSKGHVVDALKRFDPVRYAPINWANPTPDRPAPENANPFSFLKEYESGLFWDILVDFAKALRTDAPLNPIREYGKNWLYLVGWSQSGGYLARILNSFAYLPENCKDGPLFDGYLNTGSGAGNAPINSYRATWRMGWGGTPSSRILRSKEPCIAVNTESENRSTFWYGDFDEPNCKFRTWQIPCSSHDTEYTLIRYYDAMMDDMRRANTIQSWEGYLGEPMNTPYEPIFCAALQALYNWVREGVPAPHAPKIKTEMTYEPTDKTGALVANRKDIFGNALGGIRYPTADCPTATYQSYSDRKDGSIQMMFGQCTPFSPALLQAIYGDLENYRRLVEQSADSAVAKGFVLKEDRDWLVDRTCEIAAARGLR